MPIIPEEPEKYICDVCGKEAEAGRSDYPRYNLVICEPCQMRGRLWACRKAMEEESKL